MWFKTQSYPIQILNRFFDRVKKEEETKLL